MKRVGILGGAFDPPHEGHRRLAQIAWDNLELDELRFVPTQASPLKQPPLAGPGQRLAMLQRMLRGTPYSVDDTEIRRGGTSYTVDTLEALDNREPGTAWVLLIGSDQAQGFRKWREPERILKLASIAIVPRPGFPFFYPSSPDKIGSTAISSPAPDILNGRAAEKWSGAPGEVIVLQGTDIDQASSQVRRFFAEGNSPSGFDEEVKDIILKEKLYL